MMADEYIRRAEALEITTRTCGDYAAAFAENQPTPSGKKVALFDLREVRELMEGMKE